jgi:predicted DNA-binding transcriptional regulator AlpA
MPGADHVIGTREPDKLTIAEVCADLGIGRRTFYEWRAKGRAPRVHHAARTEACAFAGSNTSGGCPPAASPSHDHR